ncbi:unnamed protein product [marine sediment metagenome]|uniref:Uncharacterized protein n=1 Tax=marine sediment metagenome TaxID=412755 RepID=X0SIM0_9ZZZZ
MTTEIFNVNPEEYAHVYVHTLLNKTGKWELLHSYELDPSITESFVMTHQMQYDSEYQQLCNEQFLDVNDDGTTVIFTDGSDVHVIDMNNNSEYTIHTGFTAALVDAPEDWPLEKPWWWSDGWDPFPVVPPEQVIESFNCRSIRDVKLAGPWIIYTDRAGVSVYSNVDKDPPVNRYYPTGVYENTLFAYDLGVDEPIYYTADVLSETLEWTQHTLVGVGNTRFINSSPWQLSWLSGDELFLQQRLHYR